MDQIIGQQNAISVLQSAYDHHKLHHAYIFHGARGVGKFTTAIAFSQLLLCQNVQQDLTGRHHACQACGSCQRFGSLQALEDGSHPHPDIHIINKELALISSNATLRNRKLMNIPVDLIREHLVGGQSSDGRFHQSAAYKKPTAGQAKVFIIDDAHLLDASGQNALLKTLEEPPTDTFLILITPQEDRLLATIKSRCQRVGFSAISDQAILDYFQQHCPDIDQKQLDWSRRFAQGSLGQAWLINQYDLYQWAKTILPAIIQMTRSQFPYQLGGQMAELVDGFAKNWVANHKNASKDAANKMGADLVWSIISLFARERLMADASGGEPAIEPWLSLIDAVEQGHKAISSSVNMTLAMDHFVNLTYQGLDPQRV